MRRQLSRVRRYAARSQIRRAGQQHRTGFAQHPGHMRFRRRVGVANRQVKTFVGQIDKAVCEFELDVDVRVAFEEGRYAGRQVLAPQRHRCGHAHQAARRTHQIFDGCIALTDAAKSRQHVVDQLLAGLGQADRARGAAHQQHAGSAFELTDAHAGRGLGHAQASGCLGEAARSSQHGQQMQVGQQRGQLVRSHGRQISRNGAIVHLNEQCNHRSGIIKTAARA